MAQSNARVVYLGAPCGSVVARLVATVDEEDGRPVLICERRTTDALGNEGWIPVEPGNPLRLRTLEATVLALAKEVSRASE